MIRIDLAEDPAIHRASAKIANRVVQIFRWLLESHDRQEALALVYIAAREEIERLNQQPMDGS